MEPAVDAPRPAIDADGASRMVLDGAVVAFRRLTRAIESSGLLRIVGPSGGKATVLRCIAGLTGIGPGWRLVRGRSVSGPPDGVARVFRPFALLPWKAVCAAAAFGLAWLRLPAAPIRAGVGHPPALAGLAGVETHGPYQLSGGMPLRD